MTGVRAPAATDDESAKLLYEEIDYTLEGANAARFDESLKAGGIDYVRVPKVFWEATTPRVLTMEFVESFKLTDIERVEPHVNSAFSAAAGLANAALSPRLSVARRSLCGAQHTGGGGGA